MPRDQNPEPDPHDYRIYGDTKATIFALVDQEDYQWAIQWLWSWKKSRGSRKLYIRRSGPDDQTIYLHIEIMKRKGDVPPSELHTITGHTDGNSLNCKRSNLKWETPKTNYVAAYKRGSKGRFE